MLGLTVAVTGDVIAGSRDTNGSVDAADVLAKLQWEKELQW